MRWITFSAGLLKVINVPYTLWLSKKGYVDALFPKFIGGLWNKKEIINEYEYCTHSEIHFWGLSLMGLYVRS